MKQGVVYYKNSTNIGDDIQTFAASRLLKNPGFYDRERLDEISEKVKLLCNGWFMHDASHWPPSSSVHAHFDSIHISSHQKGCVEQMTGNSGIEYFKKHEPIGCRDFHTTKLLHDKGIDAFYSGCLTLTLPKYNGDKSNEILVVDLMRLNYAKDYRNVVRKRLIPKKFRDSVEFISHFSNQIPNNSIETRMNNVKELLERYGKAKLVITSLIHCALPCVALGTPVIFIDFGFNTGNTKRDRFAGITDMFKIYSDIQAPLSKRDLFSKGARFLKLHRFLKSCIHPLPEELFNYSTITNEHHIIADRIKERISKKFL